jgi:hypothetical protein
MFVPHCIAVVAQMPCLRATPFAWGCRMTEDGLCSLRLRTPCEWEGAVYDAVTAVTPIPVLSGQCLQLPATLAPALAACIGPLLLPVNIGDNRVPTPLLALPPMCRVQCWMPTKPQRRLLSWRRFQQGMQS